MLRTSLADARIRAIIVTASFTGSLVVAIWLAFTVFKLSVNVPFWDEWEWAPLIARMHLGHLTFGDLWKTHNEHRMLFPNLIALGLDQFGGWNQVRECMVSVSIVVATQAVIARLLRSAFPDVIALPLLFASCLLLYSPVQAENWLWGFQTAWFLINAMVVGVVWSLSREDLRPTNVLIAGACAVVAGFSSAFGLCALVAGFVVLLLRRDIGSGPRRDWLVLSAVIVFVYFFHHVPPAHRPESSGAVLSYVAYFFAWLGGPFGNFAGTTVSAFVGVAGFLAATVCGYLVFRRRQPNASYTAFAGIVSYALSASALTTIGRANYGVDQALASRYTTTADFFWIALLPLVVLAVRGLEASRGALLVGAAIASLFFGTLYVRNFNSGEALLVATHDRLVVGLSAVRDFRRSSDSSLAVVYPIGYVPRAFMYALNDVDDGPTPSTPEPSRALRDLDLPAMGSVDGVVSSADGSALDLTRTLSRTSDVTMHGWAADPILQEPGHRILALLDGKPTKIATMRYGVTRQDVAIALHNEALTATGFIATFPARCMAPGIHDFQLALLDRSDHGYYPIGDPLSLRMGSDLAVGERQARALKACRHAAD